jgi:hypothetical protein
VRRVLLLVTVALAGSLLLTAGASAASKGGQFGDNCVGVEAGAPFGSVFELSRQGSPFPAAAPVSGVLTKWIAYMPAELPAGLPPQAVRLVRLVGPGQVEITAKSSRETLHGGKNEFETRLPVRAGEHLAFGSNEAASVVCLTLPPNEIRANSGGIALPIPQPGELASFEATEDAVPVSGVVEPDRDEDGFGDISQDGCPQSADFHSACPVLHFAPRYEVGDRAIRVKVRSSLRARVAVSGLLPQLGASTGARKTIPAKKLTTFRLLITPVLNEMLHKLDSSKTLRIPFVARVNHVPGNVSTDRLTVRVPGRG